MKPVGGLTFLLLVTICSSFNYDLIKKIQSFRNVQTLLFLTCETTPESITSMTQNLRMDNTWINTLDISNETNIFEVNLRKFFLRLSNTRIVVCSLNCFQSIHFFNEISKLKMFHYERFWLMFTESIEQTVNVLSDQNINSDAEITVVLRDEKILSKYHLYDAYNPSYERQGQLNLTKLAYFNYNGLVLLQTQSKFERRRNFGGLTFQSVITIPKLIGNKTLIQHITSEENVQSDSIDRFNYHLFQLIMQMFNFKLFVRRSNIWGAKTANGTWYGSIGMLNRSEVDIMISSVRWDNERYEAFDQTTSTYFFKVVFIFRHPKSIESAKVFISPFEPKVWVIIILLGLFISFCLRVAFTMEKNEVAQKHLDEINDDRSYSNCIIIVFGYVFQQGYSGNPSLTSSRLFTTTILGFSILIFQYYGSFIVGSLLTESPKTITTVANLLDGNLFIYIDEVPYIFDNFKRVKEKSAKQLFTKVMAQNSLFIPLSKGVAMIKQGHVFHTDASYAYLILKCKLSNINFIKTLNLILKETASLAMLLTDSEKCDLQEIQYQKKLQCGPGVQIKSPLRELIKISFRKLQETGITAYHWKIWMGHKPKCEKNDLIVIPVDIVHFSSALYALFFGMQISFGFFVGEIVMRRLH